MHRDVDGKIILKLALNIKRVRLWIGLNYLAIRSMVAISCELSNEPSSSANAENFG